MKLAELVRRALCARRLPIVLALLSAALLWPALGAGFQLDDHFQRFRLLGLGEPSIQLFVFNDGDPARMAQAQNVGWFPWWAAPNFRHANLRYLSVVTMQLDYALWPDRPELMHLHSLIWLGALVAAAALWYRAILGATWIAGLAGLLYALDDAHALPAVYLANRNALIATCFGVLALLCHARARERASDAIWSAGFLALALAAGEMALATAAYLAAHALCLDRAPWRERLRALVPCAVVLALWALAYKLGGFGSTGSGFYREPLADPLGFARAALERIPFLLMGQWTPIPSDLGSAVVSDGLRTIALVSIVAIVVVFAPLVRRDRVARYFALGSVLSLLPIAAVGPQNRLLGFVGLGAMGLVAQLVQAAFARGPRAAGPLAWRVVAGAAATLLLVIHLVLAPPLGLVALDYQARWSANMARALDSIPKDPALAQQDLIVVNPPDFVYTASAALAQRIATGEPSPRRLRALVGSPTAMTLTRIDERTLRAQLELGLFPSPFSRYYRSNDLPLRPGDRITLSNFEVEILAVDAAGDPNELAYRFDVPLEDPSLRWLVSADGRYTEWLPPAPGRSVRIEAARGIFE